MSFATMTEQLRSFFDVQFLALFIATGILFLVMFIMWWIYRTLSKKDIFSLHEKVNGMSYETKWDKFLYLLKYLFVFPLYTFVGFFIFAFSLFLLIKPTSTQGELNILFISIVIVSTIRVSAYVDEAMAEDLAKLVPFALLAVLLAQPSFTNFNVNYNEIDTFFTLIPSFIKYIFFTIFLEWILRIGFNKNELIEGARE